MWAPSIEYGVIIIILFQNIVSSRLWERLTVLKDQIISHVKLTPRVGTENAASKHLLRLKAKS